MVRHNFLTMYYVVAFVLDTFRASALLEPWYRVFSMKFKKIFHIMSHYKSMAMSFFLSILKIEPYYIHTISPLHYCHISGFQNCAFGCCVGRIPNLFFMVMRCLEYLSSGENLAGCADTVGFSVGSSFWNTENVYNNNVILCYRISLFEYI